jgi:hypothetical protein
MPGCRPPGPKDLIGDHPVASLVLPAGFTRGDGAKLYDVVPRCSRCGLFAAGFVTLWAGTIFPDSFLIMLEQCELAVDSDTACTAYAFERAPDGHPSKPWTRQWFETKPYAVEALAKCTADPTCGDREAVSEMLGTAGEVCWNCKQQIGSEDCPIQDHSCPAEGCLGFGARNCNPLTPDGWMSNGHTLCQDATFDTATGKISECTDKCARNACSPARTSNLFIKQTIVGAIFGRILSFVSGQANYDASVHSIGAGTGPQCCFVLGCGPPWLALLWMIVGTFLVGLMLLGPLDKAPSVVIGMLIQQLIAEYAVFAWIDTTVACLLGWHDVKKKTGNMLGRSQDEADEEAVTVSNPMDEKDTTE